MIYLLQAISIASTTALIILYKMLRESNLSYQVTLRQKKSIEMKYSGVTCVEEKIRQLMLEFNELNNCYQEEQRKFEMRQKEYLDKIEFMQRKLNNLESEEFIKASGVCELKYEFQGDKHFKESLEKIQVKRKQMAYHGEAVIHKSKEKISHERKLEIGCIQRLIVRTFNSQCDAIVATIKYQKFASIDAKVKNAYYQINQISQVYNCKITTEYLQIRLEECKLIHDYHQGKYEEQQERNRIKENINKSKKLPQELSKIQQSLDKVTIELKTAKGKAKETLLEKQKKLKSDLRTTKADIKKMKCFANMTKPGYICITSNIGYFGKNVFKIDTTCCIKPQDILRKLGNDSVPFPPDLHAMIFCENITEFVNRLYEKLDDKRLNKVNCKKSFFSASLQDIEKAVKEVQKEIGNMKTKIKFIKTAEASEYYQSLEEGGKN